MHVYGIGGRVQGTRDRVILVVRGYISNALVVVPLGLLTLDDTGSLGYPPRWVVYRPLVSTLVTVSRLFAGNRETELKPTYFSSLLHFSVFLSFSFLPTTGIVHLVLPGGVTP